MSRTHSHKNYLGRFSDTKVPKEIHDHRHGECDLPPRQEWERMLKEVRQPHLLFDQYRCVWEFPTDYYVKNKACGCAFCTGTYDRKMDRKRERNKGKRFSKNYDTLIDEEL